MIAGNIDATAAALVDSWVRLAGEQLAADVAMGSVCDRCARKSLRTVGLAGGIPPGRLARVVLVHYGRVLGEIADRTLELVDSDDIDGQAVGG